MKLIEAQISSMIALGLSTMLIGLLPAWFSNRNRCPLFVSSLLCFGGGVLLSTSVVHMLQEVREELSSLSQYAEVIFCVGFFILYMIDEIVHYFYDENQHTHSHPVENHSNNHLRRRHSFSCRNTSSSYGATEYHNLLYNKQPQYNPNVYETANHGENFTDNPSSLVCHVSHQEPCEVTSVGKIGLLIALSIHALLEGLAVGLENSASEVLLLLGAISSHKLVVGFCLGIELASTPGNTPCQHFTSIAIFSFGSVIGIGLGMTISNIPNGVSQLVMPVLQGLAGGTLLYVTVSEVLPRERAKWHQQRVKRSAGLIQFFSVAIGFTLMTAVIKCLDVK